VNEVPSADQDETRQRSDHASDDRETRMRTDSAEPATVSHVASAEEVQHPAPQPNELTPGVCLRGRYVLESAIGRGAMGEVWRARDLLGERAKYRKPFVAIKVLLNEVERHPHLFEALHREVSRTQKLAHPNIVTMFSFEEDDKSGRPFIVMELLEGQGLDHMIRNLKENGTRIENPWRLVQGMAEGLAYAHKKGIVHSDFKPGNVFITKDGEPKILDFGIARAAQTSLDSPYEADDRDDSVISGYTEKYAAPEVLENAPPHTADDVFALGLVTYELLTGRHALGRKNSVNARAAQVRVEPIKGLTRRQWCTIEKALAYKREERWQNSRQFLDELLKRRQLQIALAASTAALLLTAGGLSYRNHLDNLPAVPFESLTQQQQSAFTQAVVDGTEALRFVRDSKLIEASADAADRFADAYAIHPRNPDAVEGLEEAADHFIEWWANNPDQARALAELHKFEAKSDYYKGYAPLQRAIEKREH
jgi:serine/threonine protein kinase